MAFVRLWVALALLACSDPPPQKTPPAPTEVGVIEVHRQAVPLQRELPGRTVPTLVAEVRPQVGGIIESRLFVEGEEVEKGQQLYQIDPAPYEAAVAEARAALQSAEATVAAAESLSKRYGSLKDMEAIAAQDADDAQARYAEAQATVAQRRAELRTARIQLGFTEITAPISGRIGISTITPGALVTAGQTTSLAVIRTLDPIYVDVTQSSAELLALRALLSGTNAAEGGTEVRLQLEDGSQYPHPGTFKLQEVAVDPSTGTVTLRAEFPNPERVLIPGMYVRAKLTQATLKDAVLVPQAAVTRAADGSASAWVVKDDKVEQRPVETQRAIHGNWVLRKGLVDGEQVVVEGVAKVRPGATVKAVLLDEENGPTLKAQAD